MGRGIVQRSEDIVVDGSVVDCVGAGQYAVRAHLDLDDVQSILGEDGRVPTHLAEMSHTRKENGPAVLPEGAVPDRDRARLIRGHGEVEPGVLQDSGRAFQGLITHPVQETDRP